MKPEITLAVAAILSPFAAVLIGAYMNGRQIEALAVSLCAEMGDLRESLRAEMGDLRESLRAEMNGLREDMRHLTGKMIELTERVGHMEG